MIALTSISPDYYTLDPKVAFIHADKKSKGGLIGELWWFRKHIQQEKPDVVIAFMEAVYEFVLIALLGSKIPVISSERLDPATIKPIRKVLRWFLLPFAKAHVVQTKEIKEYYNKRIQKKTHIIYNPVNEQVFKTLETVKKKRIISVGRLYPQKNQKMMIDAFSRVWKNFPDWQLVIFGEGFLRENLELKIKNLDLEKQILLPGLNKNVISEVAHSEIFCLSSDYEGMSNAMIEAMCVGTPIITTKVSGTGELIRDGENGLLVDIGDTEGLARAFEKLLADEQLRHRLAAEAKKSTPKFKTETVIKKWEELILSIKPSY